MSHFVIEYMFDNRYMMETITGVEDIDISQKRFDNLLGLWQCETMDEVNTLHKHLKEMRNARSGQPS